MPSIPKPPVRRQRKRFAHRRDKAYMAWIHTQPCVLSKAEDHECRGPLEAAHVKSRGAGGDDRRNVVPLCQRAHRQQHTWGIRTFELFWLVDLKSEALWLGRKYLREVAPCP